MFSMATLAALAAVFGAYQYGKNKQAKKQQNSTSSTTNTDSTSTDSTSSTAKNVNTYNYYTNESENKNETYSFVIEKGYDWNGANVPSFCWLIIGQQKEPRFKLASCVHDYMCEHKSVVGNNRYLSTLVFESLCEYFGRFNSLKRWLMFHSVDNFQKTCKWKRGDRKDSKK